MYQQIDSQTTGRDGEPVRVRQVYTPFHERVDLTMDDIKRFSADIARRKGTLAREINDREFELKILETHQRIVSIILQDNQVSVPGEILVAEDDFQPGLVRTHE